MTMLALLLALAAQPAHVVLGKSAAVEVSLRASASARVQLTSSVGSVVELRRDGRDVRARFVPPHSKAPAVAILLATIDDGDDRRLEWLALPMYGADTLDLETRPEASVEAAIAGERFGPVRADARGTVRVPVIVPPGITHASLKITDHLGNVNEKRLPLDPPPFPRIRIASRAQTATAGEELEIEAFALKVDGSPEDAPEIALEGGVRARRDGAIYVAHVMAGGSAVHVGAPGGNSIDVPVVARRSARTGAPFLSTGLVLSGGTAFSGASQGALLLDASIALGAWPVEAVVEAGGATFSTTTTAGPVQQSARTVLVQAGFRASRPLAAGLDFEAAVLAGAQRQYATRSPGGTSTAWAGRVALAAGLATQFGPGRFLLEARSAVSPADAGPYHGSLGGLELGAGYLVTLR